MKKLFIETVKRYGVKYVIRAVIDMLNTYLVDLEKENDINSNVSQDINNHM